MAPTFAHCIGFTMLYNLHLVFYQVSLGGFLAHFLATREDSTMEEKQGSAGSEVAVVHFSPLPLMKMEKWEKIFVGKPALSTVVP